MSTPFISSYVSMYASGASMEEIGAAHGVTKQNVSYHLRKYRMNELVWIKAQRAIERDREQGARNVARFFNQVRTHFNRSAYTNGCRCEYCQMANRAHSKMNRDKRREARLRANDS